jgi:hypothetical protein
MAYDYDRRTIASEEPSKYLLACERKAYDYQRVMSSLAQDVVKKTFSLISNALRLADKVVHSLKFNQKVDVHADLEEVEKPLASLARWMISRREAEAEPVAQFAKLTGDLAELTEFWNRPAFLNKDKHAAKVEAVYQKMQKVKKDILQAFRLSGSLPATRIPI